MINFSISRLHRLASTDLTETAFFHAAAAGVFVAASAGNNGPGASTVAHNGPWNTTVAASTHDRSVSQVGDARQRRHLQRRRHRAGRRRPSPLIDSVERAGLGRTADPAEVELCFRRRRSTRPR